MDLFGTAGIRGTVQDAVTPTLALAVGRAVAEDAQPNPVVVGRDGRLTGSGLADAVAAGVQSGGTDVLRVGSVPTPAIAWASRGRYGVAVTASHNPPADNGLKLFRDGVEYGSQAEARIERRIAGDGTVATWDAWGQSADVDPLPSYRQTVATYAREYGQSLEDTRIVVDCGNGVGAKATPQVCRTLGADTIALEANIDGHFPGRRSKPTPETLSDLQAFLAADSADMGIAHDGDADRVVFLDGDGTIVHEDTIVAILARHYVTESSAPDPVVVTTPNASERIDEQVSAAGGRTERIELGGLHEGIARVERDGGIVVFAAEPWKHIHTRLGGWIDGVASAAVLARLVAEQGWSSLREDITERPYRKVSVDCPETVKPAVMETITNRLPAHLKVQNISTDYGLRITQPDGSWTLVRPSGTEPKIRIYAESEAVESLVETVRSVVETAIDEQTA